MKNKKKWIVKGGSEESRAQAEKFLALLAIFEEDFVDESAEIERQLKEESEETGIPIGKLRKLRFTELSCEEFDEKYEKLVNKYKGVK